MLPYRRFSAGLGDFPTARRSAIRNLLERAIRIAGPQLAYASPMAAIPTMLAPPREHRLPSRWPRLSLHAWMLLAVAVVAAVASWDARGESSAALADFGEEQSALAHSTADAILARWLPGDTRPTTLAAVIAAVPHVTFPRTSIVLLSRANEKTWWTQGGRAVHLPPIADDLRDGWVRLSRAEAASLGLPERTATAGFASFVVAGEPWRVAVAASAERERDREQHAEWRLVLSVLLAAALVLAFGGLALRNQKNELELARELAIAGVQRSLEDRLVRADKLATLGALAIGVAHEVSTPLGVIVGRSEQLLPASNDPRVKRNAEVVLEQCDRIDRVIRGLLSLARGNAPLLEHVDPRAIAEKAVELVSHRFVKVGITLGAEIAPALPRVACEPRLLEHALANLLLNACDACAPGVGHVDLRVEADASHVAFIVTDNGKGIEPESIARVVEPFFTTKPAGEGAGLGLSIANEIVRHNRGSLTIGPRRADTGGKVAGTRACIEIPAVPRDA